jgi:DNA-binding transcriptional MerR regulator
MSDEPLLTLRQVADELGVPESTVRYYRDAFLDHIPSVGTGRRRRYPPPAVAVLRSIAEGYAAGRSR